MTDDRIAGTSDLVCTMNVPGDAASVGLARRVSRRAVNDWGAGHLADDAEVVVGELVTNATRETPGRSVRVRLALLPSGELRIAVGDESPVKPDPATCPEEDAESGRGLFIVEALSSATGVDPDLDTGGKWVWSVLSADDVSR